MKELIHKLASTDAFASLQAEQAVSATFEKNGWTAVHACFYKDHTTQKIRELDLRAVMRWGAKRKASTLRAHVNVLAECKTMKGYHLLLSENRVATSYIHRLALWDGYYTEQRYGLLGRTHDALCAGGLKELLAHEVVQKLQKIAYPGDRARPFGLMPNPNEAPATVSAFRELMLAPTKIWMPPFFGAQHKHSFPPIRHTNSNLRTTGSRN